MPLNRLLGPSATSHLLIATTSARPSCRTWSAIRRSCASSPRVPSSSSTTTSAKSTARRASATESFSSLSSTLDFLRMPAVSISRTGRIWPSGLRHSQSIAIESRVIPASGPVISRSSDEDPVDQGRFAGIGPADDGELQRRIALAVRLRRPRRPRARHAGGAARTDRPMPSPCSALIAIGSPKPSA